MNLYLLFFYSVWLILVVDFLFTIPSFNSFFGERGLTGTWRSASWRGIVAGAWVLALAAAWIPGNWGRLLSTGGLLILSRYFYIDQRWTSLKRGFGAPGFMTHWTVRYLFLLELIALISGASALQSDVLFLARFDFALIMICAGTYKAFIGFLSSDGMEYGAANPLWGYHWRWLQRLPARGGWINFQNYMGAFVEVVAGCMMLMPPLREWGALAISFSFLYIALLIRLGRLAFLMALIPAIYFTAWQQDLAQLSVTTQLYTISPFTERALSGLVYSVVLILPFVKIMQYLNLFANRSFPEPLQYIFGAFAKYFPVIMWRVFTPDVSNFYIYIYRREEPSAPKDPVTGQHFYSLRNYFSNFKAKVKFLNVVESIAIVSVFTTLKYFTSQRNLFEEKLIGYARSLQTDFDWPNAGRVGFEYHAICKVNGYFKITHVADFEVDLLLGVVSETKYVPSFDYAKPSKYSPIRESAGYGDYRAR